MTEGKKQKDKGMLVVSDRNLKEIGILENAYAVSYERQANELYRLSFSMPENDPKNELCTHFNYIDVYGKSGRYYGKYRIMPKRTMKNESEESVTYECEHVLATLLDSVMLDYHQFTNFTTRGVIEGLLDMQETKHWVLDRCDFERYFHYSFENENGLLAPLLSIPKPFDEPYLFTFDTQSYPWKLSLIRPSDELAWDIRWGRDMVSFDDVSDPSKIVNRIYPKGVGEGVNQLTIEEVNNGLPYVEDKDSIAEWGMQSYIWIDRRFESAETLKQNAQSLLNQWKDPDISFNISAVDLSIKPEYNMLEKPFYTVGEIVVGDKTYQARITGESIADIMSEEYNVTYQIANKLDDIATTQTDMERRQQVNEAYSQGATNILNFGYQDNADSNIPALIPFYIDDDVVNVNTIELTFRTKKFRAYSQATMGGGAIVESTSSGGGTTRSTSSGGGTTRSTTNGGGTTQTSSSGGGTSTSTNSGGGSSQTSSNNGTHRHRVFGWSKNHGSEPSGGSYQEFSAPRNPNGTASGLLLIAGAAGDVYTQSADGSHSHSVSIPSHSHNFSTPNHTHSISIPDHSHSVTIPNHTHDVTIPSHTHDITLPDHTHEVKHEIIELDELPNDVTIKVDGNIVNFSGTEGDRIDLIDYMATDQNGRVSRGRHEVEILPNSKARIEADLILRVFIKSRLGGVH